MVRLSTGLRNAMAGTVGLAGALANGVAYIYSGPQPLTADDAATGTLLGILTKDGAAFAFGSPLNGLTYAAAANGAVTKSLDTFRFTGLQNGTAGYCRFMGNALDDQNATTTLSRMDMAIGVSGADLNLSNIAIRTGIQYTIDVVEITIPAE